MTTDEIKATYSMRDIVEQYGFHPDRKGFIHCPFHQGDSSASLKVYENDFHCFGCNANGDIFKFVQLMDDVSFKDAFLSLGGTYEKPTFQSKLSIYRFKKKREIDRLNAERERYAKDINNALISVYRRYIERSEPMSDVWCDCYNALQYQLYLHDELNK
jgi:DNA primase